MSKVQTKKRMKRLHGKDWEEIRKKVLERDNYTCQHCGLQDNSINMSLIVHHIIPYNTCLSDELDNLLTLCQSCHFKAHQKTEKKLQRTKTDNSYFEEKVRLRLDNLPDKPVIKVLDMYMGQGLLWEEIKKRTNKKVLITGIEEKEIRGKIYLKGDNKKFILDYNSYDVIDLDAYGIPYVQIKKILKGLNRKVIICATVIQSLFGVLPTQLLIEIGYPKTMITKCPTLFYRNGIEKFVLWLSMQGISKIKMYCTTNHRKNYICFESKGE